MQQEPIISVKNVDVFYGNHHVIKNVSLDIFPNEVVALIGPSGCGKSTFLRLLNRMNDFIESFRMNGQIYIENKNIYTRHVQVEKLRKNVGMVFQKPNPFPKSVYENVVYGLRIQGIKDKKYMDGIVESMLQRVGLWNEVKDKLHQSALALSGGQQQRLCIARTLAVEPSIVLMDEPTSSLDPISTATIEELIFELKQHYTIVIVTHNMQQARRVSNKTAFFYMGELIEYDDTINLFTNPKVDLTHKYITGKFG